MFSREEWKEESRCSSGSNPEKQSGNFPGKFIQFGQPVGCLFQPFGGRVGLTVEFLVGFGTVEPEVCGQIDYLLACLKERNCVFSGRSVRKGEKEKLESSSRDNSSIEGLEKESSHPFPRNFGMHSSTFFPSRGAKSLFPRLRSDDQGEGIRALCLNIRKLRLCMFSSI